MRFSSSFVAPSAAAILSTAWLCCFSGTAMSQTATSSATPLPSIAVEAPKQAERPQRPALAADTVASRRTSPSTQTPSSSARTPSAAPDSALGKLARLKRASSSCNGGCETSLKSGNLPWVGCSYSAGIFGTFSSTCNDTLTYKTYQECKDTKVFLGMVQREARWLCNGRSPRAGLAGEKQQVAELKRSARR